MTDAVTHDDSTHDAWERAIGRYLKHLEGERRSSKHTLAAYRRDLGTLADMARQADCVGPADARPPLIANAIASMHRAGTSPRSLARWLSATRSLYRFLARMGEVSADPTHRIRAPKGVKRLPTTLDVDEVSRLLDIPADTPLAKRDRAMLELFYSSGLRLSELAGLDWTDLSEQRGLVRVIGKGQKERQVPVGRKAWQALRAWRAVQKGTPDATFTSTRGDRLSVRGIQARVRHWAERQGLWKRVHPHLLRHSFASHVLESSGDLRAVQEMLGHAQLATTQVYTHLDFQHMSKVYDQAHPRARRQTRPKVDPKGD